MEIEAADEWVPAPTHAKEPTPLKRQDLAQYVTIGIEELDMQKLAPLLALKYHSISDAKLELGQPDELRHLLSGFQKYLYQQTA